MKEARWADRYEGFIATASLLEDRKRSPEESDSLRLGLIGLLVTETVASHDAATIVTGTDQEREAYGNYRGDLIGVVADLKDPRAIPALLGVANTGGLATRGIAHFGKTALDPVLKQMQGQDSQLAEGAVFIIRDMLAYRTVSDSESLTRIKNALRSALTRPEAIIRVSAIYAIEYMDDRDEFAPALKDLARSDPHKLDGLVAEDGQDGGVVYPVRRVARALLAKIANHEAPIVDREVRP